tara:strand:+ start:163 stop:594 length:432 start_codon:yes stop_codon:yes gene_type:complete
MNTHVNRVQKYHKLLQEIAKKKLIKPSELNTLIRESNCSNTITRILIEGGLIIKENKLYKWVSPVLKVDTTVKALHELTLWNRRYNQKKKLTTTKPEKSIARKAAEWTLINSIPKLPKLPKKSIVTHKTEVNILWGMFSYKRY